MVFRSYAIFSRSLINRTRPTIHLNKTQIIASPKKTPSLQLKNHNTSRDEDPIMQKRDTVLSKPRDSNLKTIDFQESLPQDISTCLSDSKIYNGLLTHPKEVADKVIHLWKKMTGLYYTRQG